MTQTRIYLPLNSASLRGLATSRTIGSPPLAAFAVTDRLERAQPAGDEEAWEFVALCDAVEAASILRVEPMDRRVVAAADVDPAWVGPRPGEHTEVLSSVEVSAAVPLERIASFHLDENAGAEGTKDLLWYDATELDEVVRLL